VEYTKKWLPLEQQVNRLVERGLEVEDRERAVTILEEIGYYRLTGYLYPFLESEPYTDSNDRAQTRVLKEYRPGTSLPLVESVIDFDRKLRLLVLEGVERIEVAVRMKMGTSSASTPRSPTKTPVLR